MLNIADLCKSSHQISKEKGWLDDPRPFYTLCILMQSELAEALEDYRSNHDIKEIYYECCAKGHAFYGDKYPVDEVTSMLAKESLGWTPADFKPCGIPIEIADYVIRVAQWAGTAGIDLEGAMEESKGSWTIGKLVDFERVLADLNRLTSMAEWADTQQNEPSNRTFTTLGDPVTYLGMALKLCWAWAETNGIDLDKAVLEKEAFNRTRSAKHGGKKI
jgi:hypothetical protein